MNQRELKVFLARSGKQSWRMVILVGKVRLSLSLGEALALSALIAGWMPSLIKNIKENES